MLCRSGQRRNRHRRVAARPSSGAGAYGTRSLHPSLAGSSRRQCPDRSPRLGLPPEQTSNRAWSLAGGRPLAKRQVSGSGRNPLERHGKRRLSRVKRLEILYELLTRDVPTIVVRQEIERRRIVFRVTLEEDTEIGVADAAEHEARHVAGSYLRSAVRASA